MTDSPSVDVVEVVVVVLAVLMSDGSVDELTKMNVEGEGSVAALAEKQNGTAMADGGVMEVGLTLEKWKLSVSAFTCSCWTLSLSTVPSGWPFLGMAPVPADSSLQAEECRRALLLAISLGRQGLWIIKPFEGERSEGGRGIVRFKAVRVLEIFCSRFWTIVLSRTFSSSSVVNT